MLWLFNKSESLKCAKVVVLNLGAILFFCGIHCKPLKLWKKYREDLNGHIPQKINEFASLALTGRYPYFLWLNVVFLSPPPSFGEWENSWYFPTLQLVSRKMTSNDWLQNFHTNDVSLYDLDSDTSSVWNFGAAQFQTSFRGETNGNIGKCRPFCQATSFCGWLQSENQNPF